MDDLLTPGEAAAYAGVPVAQLLRWAIEGVGPRNAGTRRKPRYERDRLKQWLARKRENSHGNDTARNAVDTAASG